jgi:hypothetical protein
MTRVREAAHRSLAIFRRAVLPQLELRLHPLGPSPSAGRRCCPRSPAPTRPVRSPDERPSSGDSAASVLRQRTSMRRTRRRRQLLALQVSSRNLSRLTTRGSYRAGPTPRCPHGRRRRRSRVPRQAPLARAPGFPPGGSHRLDQVQAAAQLMYNGGDLAELALAVALFATWYRTGRAVPERPVQPDLARSG